MCLHFFFVLLLFDVISPSPYQWPIKKVAKIDGDIVLGGLHMIHERDPLHVCGPIMMQGGLQAAEVMLYTVDKVNQMQIMPKGITLGTYILDDCDRDTYGLNQAVDFIKGSLTVVNDDQYKCNDGSAPSHKDNVISGVVGAASSVTSIQVANLLKLFNIPQISFFSTSPELSNKNRFKYFSRTIPSDQYQTKVIVDIVERLNWTYISIIYEESNYGIKAYEELEKLLSKRNICVAVKEKLTKDSGVAGARAYEHIVRKLEEKAKAKGVIVFGSDQEVAGLMKAVKRCKATGKFYWIGSDGWSARTLVTKGQEQEIEGTISVQPQSNPVKGFRSYFLNLTEKNNIRNPWFSEFWESHFHCRLPDVPRTPFNLNFTVPCKEQLRLNKDNTPFEAQLQFVSDAVMAFAYGYRDMHEYLCGKNETGVCERIDPIDGEMFLSFLRNVSFVGLSGDNFRFNSKGDGPVRYKIIHYKQYLPGKFKWVTVGNYTNNNMLLNVQSLQFRLHRKTMFPSSICSLQCAIGKMKKYIEGESCCWSCHDCGSFEVLDPNDDTRCFICPLGTVPDSLKLSCYNLPETFINWNSKWAVISIIASSCGIIFSLFILTVFLRNSSTPIVKAAGKELTYLLLFGTLLCHFMTFILLLKPSNIVCALQEFFIGVSFSTVYSALLTKTNRISRIFKSSTMSAKRPNFISPKSQLIISFGIIFVQICINFIWLAMDPSTAIHHYPSRKDNLLVCKASINASYMIAFSYPIILVIICTFYAIVTRKIPEAFNESKFIGFSMYTTCIIWLAFIPIYFSTGQHIPLRITSMAITISLSGSVTSLCLFIPKLYVLILRPEKNIRQKMIIKSRPSLNKFEKMHPNKGFFTGTLTSNLSGDHQKTNVLSIGTQTFCSQYLACTMFTQTNGYSLPPIKTTSALTQEVPDVQL